MWNFHKFNAQENAWSTALGRESHVSPSVDWVLPLPGLRGDL